MTLAGDQHDVAGPGTGHRLADGEPAVADLEHLGAGAPGAVEHRGPDGRRVLGTGVVVGDDQDVGEPAGDLAHQRALPGVAVAARADHDDQPPLGERAERTERGLHGVGLVGVVDDHDEVLAGLDPLQPAGDAGAGGHARDQGGRVVAGLGGAGDGGERVGDVEVAGQRHARLQHQPVGAVHGEPAAGRLEHHVGGAPVGVRPGGREGAQRDLRDVEQAAAVRVVDVDQSAPRPARGEQGGLGGEVVVEVGVEVEVVAPEVGEDRDVEDHAVDPAQDQRVARDLHQAPRHPALAHHREQAVQVRRLRRGQHRPDVLTVDAGADGADDRDVLAGRLQAALRQPGGRRLALGAGHADQAQCRGRLAVHPRGEAAEHLARPVDHEQGYVGRRGGTLVVGEHGDGARGDRVGREADAVDPVAGQGGVEVAGQDPLGAQGHPGDRRRQVAGGSEPRRAVTQPSHQVGERGGRRPGRARPREVVVAHHAREAIAARGGRIGRWATTRRAAARVGCRSAGRRSGAARSS